MTGPTDPTRDRPPAAADEPEQLPLGDLGGEPALPDDAPEDMDAGERAAALSDREAAPEPVGRARERAPLEPEPEPPPDLYAQARELSDAGDAVSAIERYRQLLAVEPGHVRGRNNLALLLEAAGDVDGALTELDRALAVDPDNVPVLCNRAAMLSGRMRYDLAEQDLRRASRLDENNPEVLTNLGILFCRRARWREAVEPLKRAVAGNPQRAATHYHLGEAFNHVDDLPAALAAYEAAAALQPENWRALKGIGIVLDRMGRPQEAAVAYRRSREAHRQ
jgi:Flp pilus assembly protein TadD